MLNHDKFDYIFSVENKTNIQKHLHMDPHLKKMPWMKGILILPHL